ncbi:hypothetical protein [Streptomyces apocyni]|uniref:hypothetical protein n=1 Tax=Streptomyces apocyni TaxID=2654677 RepID=UPI0012EA3E67|nr:hypothetical protein [Streptomyces apocyni]
MGWTHDFSDAARNRRTATAVNYPHPRGGPQHQGHDPRVLGIPRILRRRARWVSARLRHTRA